MSAECGASDSQIAHLAFHITCQEAIEPIAIRWQEPNEGYFIFTIACRTGMRADIGQIPMMFIITLKSPSIKFIARSMPSDADMAIARADTVATWCLAADARAPSHRC